jgi:hypothetical protein
VSFFDPYTPRYRLPARRAWQRKGPGPAPYGARDSTIFFFATLAIYYLTCPDATAYDQYAKLAEALLKGSLSLPQRPPHLEMAEWQGRAYFTNPPAPALLLVPLVWLAQIKPIADFLATFNNGWPFPVGHIQTGLSLLLGAANVAFARIALGRVPVSRRAANWGAVLFGFGSIHWYHATIGSVWYIAQILHATAMWLLLVEFFGRARPALLGLCLAVAFWCRLETAVAVPFLLIACPERWLHPMTDELIPRLKWRWLFAFAAPLVGVLVLNSAYNYARFGVFGNAAYEVLIAKGQGDPLFAQGHLHWSYWDRHIHVLFKAWPIFLEEFPWVAPSLGGTAIWITTPAWIWAFAAPWDRLTASMWLGITLFMGVLLMHGGTGMTQFGYRFALDFYPMLTVLTMRGMDRPRIRWWHLILLLLSVLVNAWAVMVLNILNIQRLW